MPTVTADNTRLDDADGITGWFGIGGGQGASAEPSFPYQGANLVNRKVTSSTGGGFYYDPTSDGQAAVNLSTAGVQMAKVIVTDYGGLQIADGVRIRQGSGTNAYYEAVVAGTSSAVSAWSAYKAVGGLLIVPVDLSIAAYRNSTSGSPNLSVADYFGFVAAFASSTAKSENFGADAIDFGFGLTMTGTAGNYQDFVEFDQNTVNGSGERVNGFGYAREENGIIFAYGTWVVNCAGFTDTGSNVVWPDGMFPAGWSGVEFNTTVDASDSARHVSRGTLASVDTRAVYKHTGTSAKMFSGSLGNFASIELQSNSIVTGDIEVATVLQNNASFNGATVRTTSASGVASWIDPDFSALTGVDFIQSGAGHAIRLTSAVSSQLNLSGLQFSGYPGASGSNLTPSSGDLGAAVFNDSGKAVELNLIGVGSAPSIRNGAGATTTVSAPRTISLTDLPNGVEARPRRGQKPLGPAIRVTGNQYVYSHNSSGRPVTISIGGLADNGTMYERKELHFIEAGLDQSAPLELEPNPSYV